MVECSRDLIRCALRPLLHLMRQEGSRHIVGGGYLIICITYFRFMIYLKIYLTLVFSLFINLMSLIIQEVYVNLSVLLCFINLYFDFAQF